MAAPTTGIQGIQQTLRPPAPARGRFDRSIPAEPSRVSDGAVIERLIRMRVACKALAIELAEARRELKATRAELRSVKRRHGED